MILLEWKKIGLRFFGFKNNATFLFIWFLIQDMTCWLLKVEAFLSIFFLEIKLIKISCNCFMVITIISLTSLWVKTFFNIYTFTMISQDLVFEIKKLIEPLSYFTWSSKLRISSFVGTFGILLIVALQSESLIHIMFSRLKNFKS
jgi:hypothetical protein